MRKWIKASLFLFSACASSALAQDTIWPSSAVPSTPDSGTNSQCNMGVRFQSSEAGTISGIRFYKSAANTGTHIGTLYTNTGTVLAQATFSGESASGWQQVNFTPVSITANTSYVAAYMAQNGHFASDSNYFYTSAYSNPPLTALICNTSGGQGDGIYVFNSGEAFPTGSYCQNFWVDVVFNPGNVPGAPSNLQGAAVSSSQINLTWTASTGTVTGYYVYRNGTQVGTSATTSYSDTGLAANTQYSYYVAGYNSNGNSANSNTVQVTTLSASDTIWAPSAVPSNPDSGANSQCNMGVRFQSSEAGTISGIRFYKSAANTGTHVGTLYTNTGTVLAQATFSGESASGWQQVNFTPVSITANTSYVAAYMAQNGHFASDSNYFYTSAYSNPPLTALICNTSGGQGDGIYVFNNGEAFPTASYCQNFWVDVVFNPGSGGSAPGAPSNLQGAAVSSSQINLTWTASTGTVTAYQVYRNGTLVGSPTTTSYSDTGLAASTQYSYYVNAYNGYGTSGNSNTIQVTTESSSGSGLPANLQNFFPVGPYDQPTANISSWASRNANTLLDLDASASNQATWDSTATSYGMKYIRAPDSTPTDDIGNTSLLAWLQSDEPEANSVTAATIVAQYNAWKAIDSTRLIYLNFSGGFLLQLQGSCNASCYSAYLPGGDWLSSDLYPVAGWDSPANIVAPANWVGESVALLRSWAPAKPVFQVMESAEQNLSWCPQCPAPTPAQFHAEFWDDIINGARGVFTFPLAISPFVWDNTTAAMDTQITTDYATTKALASVLQTTLNPSGMSATVTAPLEACWRDSTHQYFIVLNTDSVAHNSEAITLTGTGSATSAVVYGESRNVNIVSGVITDNFAADTVHIYQVN